MSDHTSGAVNQRLILDRDPSHTSKCMSSASFLGVSCIQDSAIDVGQGPEARRFRACRRSMTTA